MGKINLMSYEQVILERLRTLPRDKQREVLDFVDFLAHKSSPNKQYKGMQGLWEKFNLDISEADIEDLRKEMWEPVLQKGQK